MTITQLRYLVALDQTRNFARAAEQSLIAQPTLSLQIQKLEQELGFDLFDRKKNPISPTPLGVSIIEQAKRIIVEADKMFEISSDLSKDPQGSLRIGIIPTVSHYLLPKIYPLLNKNWDKVNFKIFELPTSSILDKLENDLLDIGIAATPIQNSKMVEETLYYEPFLAYFPSGKSPKSKMVTMDEIESHPLLVLSEEHCFRNQSLKICSQNPLAKVECGSVDTLKNMADLGLGITLLPALATAGFPDRVFSIKDSNPTREISLIYKKSFFKNKLKKSLVEQILSFIPKQYTKKPSGKPIEVLI